MGKKAPKAPDPVATANAQSGMNLDTALTQQLLNMTSTSNPWGTTSYAQTGSTGFTDSSGRYRTLPTFTQTTTYTPEQQAIFNASTQAQTNLANIASDQSAMLRDYLNKPFAFEGGPDVAGMAGGLQAPADFNFTNRDAENWAYDLAQQRIAPQQAADRKALETQLVNRGLRPGTAAWNSELERLGRTQSDQNNQLALTGRNQAYNEALQTYGTNWNTDLQANQNAFQQAYDARNQMFNEAVTQRNQPLNEIASLLSGSQIANPATQSSSAPHAQVAGVDYTGLANANYNAKMSAYNAQMGALGGLFGLAGQAVIASDMRVKEDISRVGTLDNGLPWYSFRYVWDVPGTYREGLMAQDVETVKPDAIAVHHEGYLMVDYGKALN